jgi:hypothetical protein
MVVTEVFPFPTDERPAFIEFRNLSDEVIEMTGYVVATGPETEFTIQEGSLLIQPQGHLLLWLDDHMAEPVFVGESVTVIHGPEYLADPWEPSSGQLILRSPVASPVTCVVWGSPATRQKLTPGVDTLWRPGWFVHLHDSFGLYEVGTALPTGASIGLYPGYSSSHPADWAVYDQLAVSPGEINSVPHPSSFTTPDGARLDAGSFSLAWRGRRGDGRYRYQLASASSFLPATIVDEGFVGYSYYEPDFRLQPGPYFFRVQAIPSFHDVELGVVQYGRALRFFATSTPTNSTSVVLNMDHLVQRKDSPLLCLDGCEREGGLAGTKNWRSAHPNITPMTGDHGYLYCGHASVAMMVSNYDKTLSQDRIAMYTREDLCNMSPLPGGCIDQCWTSVLKAPEDDLAHNIAVQCMGDGGACEPITRTLQWALGTAVDFVGCENIDSNTVSDRCNNIDESDIKGWIDAGHPILARLDLAHFVAINGYRVLAGGTEVFVHDPMKSGPGWQGFIPAEYKGFWLGPKTAPGALSTLAWWHDDTDGDGMVDFDEIERFHTDPKKADTDSDGVVDLNDVREYVFLHTGAWDDGATFSTTCDAPNESFELVPDIDGDGLRKEVDADNDNDGCLDGIEDGNGNGVYEKTRGESNNFVGCDCKPKLRSTGCRCR